MNWIDITLALVVLLAIWAGWRKGFIVGSVSLIVWIGSLVAGLLSYPVVDGWLLQIFPSLGVWSTPLAFIVSIIFWRTILAMIFGALLRRTPERAHANGANKALGVIPGAINGLIYATILAAVLLTMPLRSNLQDETRQSRFANALSNQVGWLDEKFAPIFDDAVRKTMTGATVKPESDETVDLNFKVNNPRPRPELEAAMVELVNKERVSRGLKPVKADPELVPVARLHSKDMFARGYFSHYSPEGKDPFDRMKAAGVKYRTAGENLALGQTLRICHEGLMNSPGHRANILNPAYGRLGIGILDGGAYGLMISQEFRN